MDRQFFNKQIFRLRERFDTKYKEAYTLDMLNVLYKKLQYVANDDFERATSRLLVSAKFKPLYNDFLEILQTKLQESRTEALKKINDEQDDCISCRNMGVIFRNREKTCSIIGNQEIYNYAYRCVNCARGALLFNGLPPDKGY